MRDRNLEHEAYRDVPEPVSRMLAWVVLAACVAIIVALVGGAAWWRA